MQDNQTIVSVADPVALLQWYVEVGGADEAMGEVAVDRTVVQAAPAPQARAVVIPAIMLKTEVTAIPLETNADARTLADACQTLEELEQALKTFDACPLKRTATNTVFADGNPKARLMLVGEAPGAEEDRLGRSFVGVSGHLLDKMLAAIGYDRTNTYITNIINWRPPGNRDPSDAEIAMCLPFVRRHIELVKPEVLICVGGVCAKALLESSQGITRIRGRWIDYKSPGLPSPISCMATFHPEYLRNSPAHKALAWKDLLAIKAKLSASIF